MGKKTKKIIITIAIMVLFIWNCLQEIKLNALKELALATQQFTHELIGLINEKGVLDGYQ